MKKILVIDDDQNICTLLQRFLTKNGFDVEVAHSANAGVAKFKEKKYDVVLCDYRLDDNDASYVLKALKVVSAHTRFIVITGYSDIKTAVTLLKDGAYDYVSKPLLPDELLMLIKKSLEPDSQPALRQDAKQPDKEDVVVGESANITELYKQVDLVAPTGYSVIIYGESGTGKEVIAHTIHQRSERRNHPFVALDCGTLSRELAGSELFGHVKGSFTGAIVDKVGHFEMANGGTLFLDEVGNLSIDVQASLLRVIQERKFKRIGGTQEIEVDIRIVVASNENLLENYTAGKFREDLYHRLNEFSLTVPPLRERKEDIPLFAEYFLAKANRELERNVLGFDKDVMELMIKYPWPGNVRELANVVRRVTLLAKKDNVITKKMLPPEITEMMYASKQYQNPQNLQKGTLGLKDATLQAEYETILAVLKEVNNNKTRAAEILKVDRKTLYNKLKEFKLEVGSELKIKD